MNIVYISFVFVLRMVTDFMKIFDENNVTRFQGGCGLI
jgi:hypothetical protein